MKNFFIFLLLATSALSQVQAGPVGVFSASGGSGSGGGTPGGSNTQIQYNNAGAFGGTTSTYNSANGVFTFPYSFIRTPATITLTANAGTLAITNAYSAVTITANSTLTPSAAGTNGQTCSVSVTNAGASSFTLLMSNTGTSYTSVIPVGTKWINYVSNGTDWVLNNADPVAGTVASTSLLYFSNPGTRVDSTATVAASVSAALTTTPATVSQGGTGLATLTSGSILVGAGTGNVTFIAPGTGVATALAVNTNTAGGLDTIDGTATLTNKRVTQRVVTEVDATSWTPAGDTSDISYQSNSQIAGTLTVNAPSGTPTNGQRLILKLKSGTGVQTYAWNAIYVSGADVALPTVSTASKIDNIGFMYDSSNSKWECVAVSRGY